MPRSSGFTLLEMAIVLVIIGLLLAGVLKGQELLTSARVRSIVQQQDGIRTAYFGFVDRYRSPPGDYANAVGNVPNVSTACATAGNGNGDSRIEEANGESILAWEHLAKSGFLIGAYICTGNTVIDPNSVPRNAYGQYLQLIYDSNYAGTARDQHNLKTGSAMPSHILAEIDRKTDDGNAQQGSLRGSSYTLGAPTDPACWDGSGIWSEATSLPNCGGAVLF
jgi:prepilin-type N-terminal cleavage/methylation domain-containing protein